MGLVQLGLGDWRPERPREEKRAISLSDFPHLVHALNPPNTAGVTVTESTANRNAAFFNGLDLISSDIGKLPRHHLERTDGEDRRRLRGTPVDRVLQQPNTYTNAFDFWKTLGHHKLSWGNSYAEIEWDNALRPYALHVLTPDQVRPVMESNRLTYLYRGAKRLDPEDVLHFRGFSFDGIVGLSVVGLARLSLALGIAAEQFGGSFFGNGAWPGLVFTHPSEMLQPEQDRFKAGLYAEHRGPANANKVLIAEMGMKVEKVGIPAKDAQFLETREFQVVEVARWLNLPPHKLKHKMGERPGGNLAESEQDYLSSCLDPHLIQIEQELHRKLVAPAMRGTQYVEHDRNAHLRMLPAAKVESYKAYIDMGVLTPDQVAQKENLPKPEEKQAPLVERIESAGQLIRAGFDPDDVAQALGLPKMKHLGVLPVTVQSDDPPPAARPAPAAPLPPAPAPAADDDERMRTALRALLVDAAGRFCRREGERIRRATKRGADGLAKIEELYAEEQPVLRAHLVPGVRLVLAWRGYTGDPEAIAADLSGTYVARSKEELLALPARDVEEQAGRLVARWESARPLELAETVLGLKGERNA